MLRFLNAGLLFKDTIQPILNPFLVKLENSYDELISFNA
jgi:hypothetical protein